MRFIPLDSQRSCTYNMQSLIYNAIFYKRFIIKRKTFLLCSRKCLDFDFILFYLNLNEDMREHMKCKTQ